MTREGQCKIESSNWTAQTARIFGGRQSLSVELFKVKNTLKHGKFSIFWNWQLKLRSWKKSRKVMEFEKLKDYEPGNRLLNWFSSMFNLFT